MTKKKALRKCVKAWTAIAQASLSAPAAYAAKQKAGYPVCPACEYNNTHAGYYCGNNCIVPWSGNGCGSPQSEYTKWREALERGDNNSAVYWAQQIAALAGAALNALA